jgi:hypothetical protein
MFTVHTIGSAYPICVNGRNENRLGALLLECFTMEENMKICQSLT